MKKPAGNAGIKIFGTLNRWGAGYPEKKARRESSLRGILIRGVEGPEFCRLGPGFLMRPGSRILRGLEGEKARGSAPLG